MGKKVLMKFDWGVGLSGNLEFNESMMPKIKAGFPVPEKDSKTWSIS